MSTYIHALLHGPGLDQPLGLVQDDSGNCSPLDAVGFLMDQEGDCNFTTFAGFSEPALTLQTDGLGSVTTLINQTRDFFRSTFLAERVTYDSFGTPIFTPVSFEGQEGPPSDRSAFHHPYAFTGREWDPESGLYYYRARYYDPKLGRFLQEDPIGVAGGPNAYVYVRNMPVTRIDPYGLVDKGFVKNKGIEFVIGEKLKEAAPGVPGRLRGKAAQALRKEMTEGELVFLQHPEGTKAEKEQVTEGLIQRTLENPENLELRKQAELYLPPELKGTRPDEGAGFCPIDSGGSNGS